MQLYIFIRIKNKYGISPVIFSPDKYCNRDFHFNILRILPYYAHFYIFKFRINA